MPELLFWLNACSAKRFTADVRQKINYEVIGHNLVHHVFVPFLLYFCLWMAVWDFISDFDQDGTTWR